MRAAKLLVLLTGLLRECQATEFAIVSLTTTTVTTTTTLEPGAETRTTTTTTTQPLCIRAATDFWKWTFDDGTGGKCADENGTVVRSVWRGDLTLAECQCQCLSEPKCLGYSHFERQKACEMHGATISTVDGRVGIDGDRLYRRPEARDWVLEPSNQSALRVTDDPLNAGSQSWLVSNRTGENVPIFGEFAKKRSEDDWVTGIDPTTGSRPSWNCFIKINRTDPPEIEVNTTFLCPLGDKETGNDKAVLTCQSQEILMIFFVFVAPFICCCSFLVVFLQFMKKWECICECISSICCGCRRPKRGKETCGDFGRKHGKLGWHTEKVREERGMKKGELEAIVGKDFFSGLATPGGMEDPEAQDQDDGENYDDGEEQDQDEEEESAAPAKKGRCCCGRRAKKGAKVQKPKAPKAKVKEADAAPPKDGKKKRVKTHVRTHVIWDLDTVRVAEAIGAKAAKRKAEMLRLEDEPTNVMGEIPHLPDYLNGRSIPSACVDLGGVWGNFILTAKIITTERDGVIVGKVMPKGTEGTGAPKVLMLHDAKLRWVCPDEVGNLQHLDGHTEVADGKEHEVGICYDRGADRHVLIVDGEPDGCNSELPLSVDCDDATLILGSNEWPTRWNFTTPNGRFHFFGEIWDVKWNGGFVHPEVGQDIRMTPTMYLEGENIEYFSITHGMWMLGNVSVSPPKDSEDGGVKDISYGLLMPASKQTRHGVALDCMRQCLSVGDACEVFSQAKGGNRWKQGEVVEAKTSRALPSYKIRPVGKQGGRGPDSQTTMMTSTVVRQRFLPGSRVYIYREPKEGWTGCWTVGKVLPPNLSDVQRGIGVRGWAPGESPDRQGGASRMFGARVKGPIASDVTLISGPSVTGPEATVNSMDSDYGAAVTGPNITRGSTGSMDSFGSQDTDIGAPVKGANMSTGSALSNQGMGEAVGGPTWSNLSSRSYGMGGAVGGALQSNQSAVSQASSGSKLERRMKAPKEKDNGVLGYWVMVPIQEEGSDERARETVPSYLIRLAPQGMEQIEETEETGDNAV